jgi:hypothetical protein
VDGVRQRLYRMIIKQMGVGEPSPVLRTTLRSWIASVETAGLDWLEHRDLSRAALERLLVDHMVALLGVAAEHDPTVGHVFAELTAGEATARIPPAHEGALTSTKT